MLMNTLGPRKKIIPHLACLLARHLRSIPRHISRYAPGDAPWWQTHIRRHIVELFISATLKRSHFRRFREKFEIKACETREYRYRGCRRHCSRCTPQLRGMKRNADIYPPRTDRTSKEQMSFIRLFFLTTEDTEITEKARLKNVFLCDLCALCGKSYL